MGGKWNWVAGFMYLVYDVFFLQILSGIDIVFSKWIGETKKKIVVGYSTTSSLRRNVFLFNYLFFFWVGD
jgi:hypothetical protein